MTDTLTQAELDTLGCGNPDCSSHDHSVIYLHCDSCSREDENLAIFYEKPTGEMVIECTVCERELGRIAVKES